MARAFFSAEQKGTNEASASKYVAAQSTGPWVAQEHPPTPHSELGCAQAAQQKCLRRNWESFEICDDTTVAPKTLDTNKYTESNKGILGKIKITKDHGRLRLLYLGIPGTSTTIPGSIIRHNCVCLVLKKKSLNVQNKSIMFYEHTHTR